EESRWLALGVLANEVVAGYRALAHDVTLELRAEPALLVPEMTVRRVLDNLLGNAVEHGRPPIAVLIELRADHRLALQVSDHGDGIPVTLEREARSPFVKLDCARGTAGCGLGLAIVQQLASRAGGELSFLREAGRFTVAVTLRLPRNNS
ncbi:MAG: protein histidine kinase/phosphatase sensor for OmpR, partial [Pseudomonadota bacterium]